jgi:GNAT superfamily N-acetyltransferase
VSHRNTRFYTDPHFGADRSDAMYEHWIERSCEGAAEVFVAGPEGDPTGYLTVHAEGTVGLMAVRPELRHQGWGQALLLGALAWLEGRQVSRASFRTQSTNAAARRMCLGRGGRLASTELAFHKWLDDPHG